MTDITNQVPLHEILKSNEERYSGNNKWQKLDEMTTMPSDKIKFAVEILKRYAEQSGSLPRSTNDLSLLEKWLIAQLFEEKMLPKLSGVKNGTESKLFQKVLAEAKEYSPHLFRNESFEACANIGRNILSKIDND